MTSITKPSEGAASWPSSRLTTPSEGGRLLEEAPTSIGTSTPSEVASTPRQASQEQPRWSDIVDDDFIIDEEGIEADCNDASPSKTRRRRRRGTRTKKGEYDDFYQAEAVDVKPRTTASASQMNQQDRAVVTLFDLGLLVSPPKMNQSLIPAPLDVSAQQPAWQSAPAMDYQVQQPLHSPSRALMSTQGIMGTSPVHAQSPLHFHNAAPSPQAQYQPQSPYNQQFCPGAYDYAYAVPPQMPQFAAPHVAPPLHQQLAYEPGAFGIPAHMEHTLPAQMEQAPQYASVQVGIKAQHATYASEAFQQFDVHSAQQANVLEVYED